jgi:hypothetical protein
LATGVVSEPLVTAPFCTSFNIPFAAVHRDVGDGTALRLQGYVQAQPILKRTTRRKGVLITTYEAALGARCDVLADVLRDRAEQHTPTGASRVIMAVEKATSLAWRT